MSLDNTWVQWVLLGIRQFYLISSHLIGLTEFFSGIYGVLLGLIGIHCLLKGANVRARLRCQSLEPVSFSAIKKTPSNDTLERCKASGKQQQKKERKEIKTTPPRQ